MQAGLVSITPIPNGWTFSSEPNGLLSAYGTMRQVAPGHYEAGLYLENNTDAAIDTKFSYPYILYNMDENDVRVFSPVFGGVLDRISWPACATYPGQASFCLTASATANRCVAAGLYNSAQLITSIRNCCGGQEGHLRLTLEKVTVPPHSKLAVPTLFIGIGGNWAEAMEPYRRYLMRAFPPRNERPAWMLDEKYTQSRAGHCLAPYNPPQLGTGVILFSELGSPRTYEQIRGEIDAAIKDGEARGYKPLFYQFGWWENLKHIRGMYQFDSFCGDYTASTETARRIVKYIHERGCRTYLYTNAIAAGDETNVFRQHSELFVHGADGLPVYNDWLPMYMFCPSAPGIRNYWDKTLQFILLDMDADGIFLDQICGAVPPPQCYDPSHHHENSYSYGTEIIKLVDYIRKRAKELKPDACVMGELVLDSRSVLLDESHGYGYSKILSVPPDDPDILRNRVPSEYYVFTRFLSPEIHTQIGGGTDDICNGAAGSFGDEIWSRHHAAFEESVIPCKTNTRGAVAYLFGQQILAVRADCQLENIEVTLPDGRVIQTDAGKRPKYIPISSDERKQ